MNRTLDDIPPQASDAELLEWGASLQSGASTAERPRPPVRIKRRPAIELRSNRVSDEELFADIFERAAAVSGAHQA